jgi:HAD superfamily hydrolase (TIGR01459 family)
MSRESGAHGKRGDILARASPPRLTASPRDATSGAPEHPAAEGPSMTDILYPAGLAPLAESYRVIISDVWGVVHNGISPYPAAGNALAAFRKGGGIVIMVSNAPRPHPSVIAQLGQIGVRPDAYDAIITSGDVTVSLMRARRGQPCYHIGAPQHDALFIDEPAERVAIGKARYIVCAGLVDDENDTLDDYRDALAECRQHDLPMICANPDLVVERGHRMIICAGTLADHYASLGGEVIYAGKPHRPIYELALAKAVEIGGKPVDLAKTLAIGDAMRTDVAGARQLGVDCLFLAAGIHTAELFPDGALDRAAVARLSATAGEAPRYAMERLVWGD